MEAQNLNTGSLSAVPSNVFPPGMRWNSRRDMLHDIMCDLHRGWVQDYLFGRDSSDDARILSSPAQLSRSFAFTFMERLQFPREQGATSTEACCTSVVVPAFQKDDIGAAISVEHQSGGDIPFELYPRRIRFSRCVRNNRTGIICTLSFDDKRGVVEACFYSLASLSNAWHVLLTFEAAGFERAFTPGTVDFDILEQSIMNMFAGYSHSAHYAPTCEQPTDMQSAGASASLSRLPDNTLATWAFIAFGESQYKSVLSVCNEGVPIIRCPIFASTSRNFGAAGFVIDEMVRWGMRDRLCRLQPVVPAVMPFAFEDFDGSKPVETVDIFGIEAFADDVDKILSGYPCDVLEELEQIDSENNFVCSRQSTSHLIETSSSTSPDPSTLTEAIQNLPLKEPSVFKGSSQGAVRIAPAPATVTNGIEMPIASASYVAALEKEKLTKLEQRKIRRREAAFRSNAKRSEERRKARLAQEKGITPSQSVT